MSETSTPASTSTSTSTSTSVSGNETVSLFEKIKECKTEELIDFLSGEKFLDLVEKDLEVFCQQRINGYDFLMTTRGEFISYGIPGGPAKRLAKFVNELNKQNETIEIYCTATYGKKKTRPFQWTITREMATLVNLKKKLSEYFKFPDGTEHDHLAISLIIGGRQKRKISDAKKPGKKKKPRNSSAKSDVTKSDVTKSDVTKSDETKSDETKSDETKSDDLTVEARRIIRISTDEDLSSIICNSGPKMDLEIIVNTSQQAFSSYTFSEIRDLFGLEATSHDQLHTFQLDGYGVHISAELVDSVINEILRRHQSVQTITSGANESSRREFISPIIFGVASVFGGIVRVYPEYQVSGSHGNGPIDWVIKIGDFIITITEAKKECLDQGVAQSTVQALASMQCNLSRKRNYDDIHQANLVGYEMFCIITTGIEWVITKVVQRSDEHLIDVYLCVPMPEPLPINRKSLCRDDLLEPVKILLEQIMEVFNRQRESVGSDGKRVKL